ncbi:MAG: GH36 C-terminal domain-containing protein, partial [Actinomycetota bacterium]
ISFAQLTTARSLTPPPLRAPGLDRDARYRVTHVPIVLASWGPSRTQPAWLGEEDGVVLTGAQLVGHGIQPPVLNPESAVVIHLERI